MDKKPSFKILFYELEVLIELVTQNSGLEITITTSGNSIHNAYLTKEKALRVANFIKESFQDKDTPICINEGNIGKGTT
jgi:predicted component of type VI protein secretion system